MKAQVHALSVQLAEGERRWEERLAAEKAELLAAAKAQKERLAAERAEAEPLAAEKAEAERLAAEKAEAERLAAEKAEAEPLAAEKAEVERLATEKAEKGFLDYSPEMDRIWSQSLGSDELWGKEKLNEFREVMNAAIRKKHPNIILWHRDTLEGCRSQMDTLRGKGPDWVMEQYRFRCWMVMLTPMWD